MQKKILRTFIHYCVIRFVQSAGELSIPVLNALLMLSGTGLHYEKCPAQGKTLCRITERLPGSDKNSPPKIHYFHLPERAHIYLRGVSRRGRQIAASYGIDRLTLNAGDIILDVGANSGDLLIYLSDLNIPLTVRCFEPDPIAFASLQLNCNNLQGALAVNKALGDKCESTMLYLSTLGGDSSLSEPATYDATVQVNSLTLDSWLQCQTAIPPDKEIKLLKLEAEGFEPEILEGAKEALHRIHYITADLGWERGKSQDCTIPQVVNLLLSHNFVIEQVCRDGVHYIFRNNRC